MAAAFDEPLVEHPALSALVRAWPGPVHPARLRMAMVPRSATVHGADGLPAVRVERVWVLPGVPRLFRAQVEALEGWLRGPRRACSALWTTRREAEFAALLEALERDWPGVEVGSYPLSGQGRVLITVEADDAGHCRAAAEQLAAALPADELRHDYHPEDEG